jgi:hypothetical protein
MTEQRCQRNYASRALNEVEIGQGIDIGDAVYRAAVYTTTSPTAEIFV